MLLASVLIWSWAEAGRHGGHDEYAIVMGNPGVGKSTLLNSMFQKALFESGPNPGGGLTKVFQTEEVEFMGKTLHLIDTPGLADADSREACAREIETGLKQGGAYRIFVIVRQHEGRVVDEDKTTLKLILDALPTLRDNQFGILVNQVPPKMMKKFGDAEWHTKFLNTLMSGLSKTTKHVRMIARVEELEAEPNSWFPADSPQLAQASSLLKEIPSAVIEVDDVKQVNTNDWDEEKLLMQKQLEKLEEDAAYARAQSEKHFDIIGDFQRRLEDQSQRAQEREAMFNRQMQEQRDDFSRTLERSTSGK